MWMRYPLSPIELFRFRQARAEVFHRGDPEGEGPYAMGFASFLRFFYSHKGPPLYLCFDPGFDRASWMLVDHDDGPNEKHLPLGEVSKATVYLLAEHEFLGVDVAAGSRARRILPIYPKHRSMYPAHADVIEAGHFAGLRFLSKELEYDSVERDKLKDRIRFQAKGRL